MRVVGNSTARVRTNLAALNGREIDDSPTAGQDRAMFP